MMIERPKVTSSGGRMSPPSDAVEQRRLQRRSRARTSTARRSARRDATALSPRRLATTQNQIGGEHDEVAMREVDEAHDAEDQRQARRRTAHRARRAARPATTVSMSADHAGLMLRNRPAWIGSRVSSRGWPGQRHASFLQAIDAVGDRERPADVLLDDRPRRVPFVANRGQRRVDVVDDDRREAEADLVAQQDRGLDISARPIATICCWPPESAVARRLPALPQSRKQRDRRAPASTATAGRLP